MARLEFSATDGMFQTAWLPRQVGSAMPRPCPFPPGTVAEADKSIALQLFGTATNVRTDETSHAILETIGDRLTAPGLAVCCRRVDRL